MQSVLIEIPEEIVSQIKLPPKRAKQMIMEELAIRLYQQPCRVGMKCPPKQRCSCKG